MYKLDVVKHCLTSSKRHSERLVPTRAFIQLRKCFWLAVRWWNYNLLTTGSPEIPTELIAIESVQQKSRNAHLPKQLFSLHHVLGVNYI